MQRRREDEWPRVLLGFVDSDAAQASRKHRAGVLSKVAMSRSSEKEHAWLLHSVDDRTPNICAFENPASIALVFHAIFGSKARVCSSGRNSPTPRACSRPLLN